MEVEQQEFAYKKKEKEMRSKTIARRTNAICFVFVVLVSMCVSIGTVAAYCGRIGDDLEAVVLVHVFESFKWIFGFESMSRDPCQSCGRPTWIHHIT